MDIVVQRRGGLGDTLLFLPVLQALRCQLPGRRVLFAGHGDFLAPVLQAGLADRVRSVEGWEPLRELYRRGGPEGSVPRLWQEAELVLLQWEKEGEWGPVRLYDPAPVAGVSENLSRQFLKRFGLLQELPWPPPPPLAHLRRGGNGPVVLHAGSGGRHKMWPVNRFQEVAERLRAAGREVVMVGGPAEVERGVLPVGAQVVMQVDELMELLAGAVLYVGNDSGPTHLAAAMDVPTLALFGPTDPAVWAPPWPSATPLRAGGTMTDLTVAKVLTAIGAMI